MENKCLVCETVIPYQDRAGNQPRYCSDEHKRQGTNERIKIWKRANPRPNWKPDVPKKICPVCKIEFAPWKNQVYCSHKCSSKVVPQCQPKALPRCEVCGKETKKHFRRFCSSECKVEWYRGKEVYNYLGGQARDHYASSFWLELANKIRMRDKVCQSCGRTPRKGQQLHVHHIDPWRNTKDDSEANLIALCPACHKKADWELLKKE